MDGAYEETVRVKPCYRQRGMLTLGLIGLLAIVFVATACGRGTGLPSGPDTSSAQAAAKTGAPAGAPLDVSDVTLAPTSGQVSSMAPPSSSEGSPFFCYVEILTGNRPSIYGYQAPRGCVPSAEFKRGELVVWRFVILDTATGKNVTDKEAQGVKIRLPDGTLVDAVYKQRGDGSVPNAPWTWDVCWDIPLDYSIGALDYSIIITTKDGRSGTWSPPSFLDPVRGFDSRPRIMP